MPESQQVTVTVNLAKQVLTDVLTSGVESEGHALWYWDGFQMINVDRDGDLNVESITFDCHHLLSEWTDEPEAVERYTITWRDLGPAIEAVLRRDDAVSVNPQIVARIATILDGSAANEEYPLVDLDAECADVLIQIAAFGEVVYG